MRVLKYRDTTRLTLYGRYDKNVNDATSIYSGYDRALTTTTGGGINSISLNQNTYLFTATPNIFIANISSYNNTLTPQTMSNYYSKSVTITTAGNYTSAPTVYLSDTNLGMTITSTIVGGYITAFTVTNPGNILFSSAPTVVLSGGGGTGATASVQINAIGVITGLTIINGGTTNTYATNPSYYFSGGGINLIAVITTNALSSITNTSTFTMTSGTAINVTFVGGGGTGGGAANISFGRYLTGIPTLQNPYGSFITIPTVSFNGGDINITPTMNGGNTIITGITITTGGSGFTSAPTLVFSGTGYATAAATLTNGAITGITLPVSSGINLFTGIPTVSVYGGGLPTASITLNQYNITIGGFSPYQNTKRLRFDLNQELQSLRLSDNAEIYLEFVRMPALSVNSTCFKNLRLIGANNENTFDSIQGSTGNPILFTCESGNVATNYNISASEYSRLSIPPNFLSKGFIEFEMDTILSANTAIFTAAQLNELIMKLVIEEPDNEITQDNNLGPEYTKGRILYLNHHNK